MGEIKNATEQKDSVHVRLYVHHRWWKWYSGSNSDVDLRLNETNKQNRRFAASRPVDERYDWRGDVSHHNESLVPAFVNNVCSVAAPAFCECRGQVVAKTFIRGRFSLRHIYKISESVELKGDLERSSLKCSSLLFFSPHSLFPARRATSQFVYSDYEQTMTVAVIQS